MSEQDHRRSKDPDDRHLLYSTNLATSRAPRAYRDNENLWRKDLKRIYRLIDRQVGALSARSPAERRREDDLPDARPHLAIAIFGPSGAGKSSLLQTLTDDVRRTSGSVMPPSLRDHVISLPVMDPTTWRPTDQFLYAFLAAALEKERDHLETIDRGFTQGLSPTQLAFQRVNEYLRVVDDPGKPEDHDPLGLSLQKLERHTSGLRLRNALGKFIEKLTTEMAARVILLPVDDLDMAPEHLIDSLQTYQSFLRHPRLVPVFTFTDRMPEELLEAHFERQFTLPRHGGNTREYGERLPIARQLSLQFLARCFPVRNRIRLGPAPARVQRSLFVSEQPEPAAGSERSDGQQPMVQSSIPSVRELLVSSSFLLFGHPDLEDAHSVRAALRPSTLRRQLQVVDAMADCQIGLFRAPQLAVMAEPEIRKAELTRLAGSGTDSIGSEEFWEGWRDDDDKKRKMVGRNWTNEQKDPLDKGYSIVAERLRSHDPEFTWATVFNGATWSILNVHRDTLQELGLYLEDLYSWSPKDLRSVVVDKILALDTVVRRSLVDRWFNRTDQRRSQVLSLLAANVFRPWMPGEEAYGDEEIPLRRHVEFETRQSKMKGGDTKGDLADIRERLTFPATEGLLWFLNVTLGFYLPQVMARNWSDALSPAEPVRSRMSGTGWDLRHAPVNAIRIASARQEPFGFGMIFIDPRGYRHALEAADYESIAAIADHEASRIKENLRKLEAVRNRLRDELAKTTKKTEKPHAEGKSTTEKLNACQAEIDENESYMRGIEQACGNAELRGARPIVWGGAHSWRSHILLRIWSCYGYSHGRIWAAFSLWRGLGFIGQALELTAQHNGPETRTKLEKALVRLIRAHCLAGMVPGALLDRGSDEDRLLHGFPRWEPHPPADQKAKKNSDPSREIDLLAKDLADWLEGCGKDRIVPLPAGQAWLGWSDCFIRRIHGEYILGGLWPRLKAAYLEEHTRYDCQLLARRRSYAEDQIDDAQKDFLDAGRKNMKYEDRFRWTAALAAGAWSDLLLEYWRGNPSILRLLLSCPVFWKSRERFGPSPDGGVRATNVLSHLANGGADRKIEIPSDFSDAECDRLVWLRRLALPPDVWKDLTTNWWKNGVVPALVSDELCIERVDVEHFATREVQHHDLKVQQTGVRKPTSDSEKLYDSIIEPLVQQYPPPPKPKK